MIKKKKTTKIDITFRFACGNQVYAINPCKVPKYNDQGQSKKYFCF